MSKLLTCCALSSLSALLLTGCGTQFAPSPALQTGTSSVGALQGSVHGGQPPVVGSHVYLFESVATGYGNPAHSLLGPAANTTSDGTNYYVTTDSGGSFSLTGSYSCTIGAQVYVFALGGNAGGGANASIGLMSALGQCPSTQSLAAQVPLVIVNEVSTVAAAYALAGFMGSPAQLSIPNTALAITGLANANANALNVVSVATGNASTTTLAAGSRGTVPQAKIYTLADILASCVNSSGSGSTPCTSLFQLATSDGTPTGTQPGNTAQAILNIAHFPGSNVAALYALAPPVPVFVPTLSTQPNDFLLPITYANPIGTQQNAVVIDSVGNAWVAGANLVGKISPLGTPSLVYTGLPATNYSLSGLAIAPTGNAWVSDFAGNTVAILNSSGLVSTSAASVGGLNGPTGIAFDGSGRAYVENYRGNSVSFLNPSATAYNVAAINSPSAQYQIAVDSGGGAWISSYDSSIKNLQSGASAVTAITALPGRNLGVAIGSNNTVWVGGDNGSSGSIAKLSSSGAVLGTFTGGGISSFYDVAQLALDGAGNAWGIGATYSAGYSYSNFVAVANTGVALSPSTGYQNAANFGNLAIAIDGSGDVWVTNSNQATTEFLGAAVPVATPILPGQLGARP